MYYIITYLDNISYITKLVLIINLYLIRISIK